MNGHPNMTEPARIAMLIPYYGKWPEWLGFSLRSFSSNSLIHYKLITDLEEPPGFPANVSIYRFSLDEFASRIEETLVLKPLIRHPFKLTDFKPALGQIFSDLTE